VTDRDETIKLVSLAHCFKAFGLTLDIASRIAITNEEDFQAKVRFMLAIHMWMPG